MSSHSFVSTTLRETNLRYFNLLFEFPSLESATSLGLRGNVGYVVAWVKSLSGLRDYVSQNIFYVGCVGHFFTWVQILCVS